MAHMDNQLDSYFTYAVTPVNAWKILCQIVLLFIICSLVVFIKHVCCRFRKWHSLPTEFYLSKSVLAFLWKHKFRSWILKETQTISYILWFFLGKCPRKPHRLLPKSPLKMSVSINRDGGRRGTKWYCFFKCPFSFLLQKGVGSGISKETAKIISWLSPGTPLYQFFICGLQLQRKKVKPPAWAALQ